LRTPPLVFTIAHGRRYVKTRATLSALIGDIDAETNSFECRYSLSASYGERNLPLPPWRKSGAKGGFSDLRRDLRWRCPSFLSRKWTRKLLILRWRDRAIFIPPGEAALHHATDTEA